MTQEHYMTSQGINAGTITGITSFIVGGALTLYTWGTTNVVTGSPKAEELRNVREAIIDTREPFSYVGFANRISDPQTEVLEDKLNSVYKNALQARKDSLESIPQIKAEADSLDNLYLENIHADIIRMSWGGSLIVGGLAAISLAGMIDKRREKKFKEQKYGKKTTASLGEIGGG